MRKKILLASIAILGSIELSAYTYEVNPLIGKNFTEDGSLVDDSTALGIRVNKYITEDNAIMFGYTRINSADYKRTTGLKGTRTNSGCVIAPCTPAADECGGWYEGKWDHCKNTTTDSSDDNQNDMIDNDTGTSDNSNLDNHDNQTPTPSVDGGDNAGTDNEPAGSVDTDTGTGESTSTPDKKVLSNTSRDTDINRFYINGLHNIKTKYSRLVPYVYGGFGYEDVENEFAEYKSQGFFNAGGGLKFRINDKFNLVSDIQAIKKFKTHDLDILGSLGVSFLFGKAFQPEPEALVASGLEDVHPAPQRNITIVKVAPQPQAAAPVVTAPKGEYYVQMAAGFKTDMETGCKHTKDLRDAGIDYEIKYTTIKDKNAALVVVGPYESKAEATSHLAALKKYSKDAFVKRIKN